MSSVVGIASSAQGATIAPVAAAPAPSLKAAPSIGASTSSGSTSLQNPRVTLDPEAGFITQYLSADGSQVISQTPGAITVAYLRLGLTADGLSKAAAAPTSDHVGKTA
jgi:hypothetical protein